MATEEGIVIAVNTTTAQVKTTRSSACKQCSARESCQTTGNENIVEARNHPKARVGDRILLSIETASLLKASFLIYIFPILGMLAGALIGQKLGLLFNRDPSVPAAVLAAIFFGAAVFYMKSKGNRLAQQAAYQPKIIRILKTSPLRKNGRVSAQSPSQTRSEV